MTQRFNSAMAFANIYLRVSILRVDDGSAVGRSQYIETNQLASASMPPNSSPMGHE